MDLPNLLLAKKESGSVINENYFAILVLTYFLLLSLWLLMMS
jgi:hypothetical protein